MIPDLLKRAIKQIPPIKRLTSQRDQLLSEVSELRSRLEALPGATDQPDALGWWRNHPYHSPLPDLDDVRKREDEIFSVPDQINGVDLQTEAQLRLVDEISKFYKDQPFAAEKTADVRYYHNNGWFNGADALALYGLLRHLGPARVIEIGSGYSSAVMLDTRERFLDAATNFTFIDPEPERLMSLLNPTDMTQVELLPMPLQKVDPSIFSELTAGDVLFVDSSHVSRIGSDVNFIFFEIIPNLAPGIFVHFHDIFYPFEYPKPWVFEGRAWNEAYMLRTFLAFNADFQIRLFNSYLERFHNESIRVKMPLWAEQTGGASMWMERV